MEIAEWCFYEEHILPARDQGQMLGSDGYIKSTPQSLQTKYSCHQETGRGTKGEYSTIDRRDKNPISKTILKQNYKIILVYMISFLVLIAHVKLK